MSKFSQFLRIINTKSFSVLLHKKREVLGRKSLFVSMIQMLKVMKITGINQTRNGRCGVTCAERLDRRCCENR